MFHLRQRGSCRRLRRELRGGGYAVDVASDSGASGATCGDIYACTDRAIAEKSGREAANSEKAQRIATGKDVALRCRSCGILGYVVVPRQRRRRKAPIRTPIPIYAMVVLVSDR